MTIRSICLAVLLLSAQAAFAAEPAPPKLVLFITVDQLRGDMPSRFGNRFEGGLKHLMSRGVQFTNANYRHAATFTATGHATLVTGGNPPEHGMAGNDWHDRVTGEMVYCVEDDRFAILGGTTKPHAGTSPRLLTSSTIGDELILASGRKGRVFSVAGKDRGAILQGGQLGKAFWFDDGAGRFVTSTYYYDAYPSWASKWNEGGHVNAYAEKSWDLLRPRGEYLFADKDDQAWERPYKKLGRTFPHPLKADKPADFYATLSYTPMSDEITVAFAIELLRQENLGRAGVTDMLTMSLSATDYVGHSFGPDSLEAEDNLLRLDAVIATLFKAVDEQVGLDRTLIVLSSDHGVDEAPEYRHSLTCPQPKLGPDFVPRNAGEVLMKKLAKSGVPVTCCGSGRHFPEKFLADANAALKKRFKIEKDLVIAFWNPSLYLDEKLLAELSLDLPTVETVLAEHIRQAPGFANAFTRTDLLVGRIPADPISAKVMRSFHPTRTGNVVVLQSQSWYLYPKATAFAAMHGSPYAYDTHVPIFFAGAGIEPGKVSRAVGPEDIASTVAMRLGIKAPTGNVGQPLQESLDRTASEMKRVSDAK